MASTLPRVIPLITDTWTLFAKTWDTTVRYSSWVILAVLLQEFYAFIPGDVASLRLGLQVLGGVAGLILAVWVSIRVYLVCLALNENQSITPKTTASALLLIPGLIWVAILQTLVFAGGIILLIIPGIYVGIRLSFSQIAYFSKGLRGREALAYSWKITKNRFWAIVGRELAGGILFALAVMTASFIAIFIVGSIAGGSRLEAVLANEKDPMGAALVGIMTSIIQAALIPALTIFQVKLFRALEKVT